MTSNGTSRHDLAAIGCGPFNLGLAALASGLDDIDLVAFEASAELRWHSGLMFDDALLQLSFLADLVTLVDPTHPLSFLSYLKDVDRIYPFFIRERFHPTRKEYEDYLRWAAGKLHGLRFSHRVESVSYDANRGEFVLSVVRNGGERLRARARNLVLGIGTAPYVPPSIAALPATSWLHSSDYLHRPDVARAEHVTVVGSGQSAAEIVVDLLRRNVDGGPAVSWLTRTATFAPLDYTKLVLEMTTPAYVRYFHALPAAVRDSLNASHWQLYKGISTETIEQIHDLLYQRELTRGLAPVELRCGVAVRAAESRSNGDVLLECTHKDTGTVFERATSLVVAATGYRERVPSFLQPIESLIRRDERGRYRVRLDYSIELDPCVRGRIFVANAEVHTHGVATPDLGMSAYRNATILNTILGREVYRVPVRTAFSSFAVPAAEQRTIATPAAEPRVAPITVLALER
jgi:lysine N6-hydroxylase